MSLKSSCSSSSMSSLKSLMEIHTVPHSTSSSVPPRLFEMHHILKPWQYCPWKCYPKPSEPIHTAIHDLFTLPVRVNVCCVEYNIIVPFQVIFEWLIDDIHYLKLQCHTARIINRSVFSCFTSFLKTASVRCPLKASKTNIGRVVKVSNA